MELIAQLEEISKEAVEDSKTATSGDEVMLHILRPFMTSGDEAKKSLASVGVVSTTIARRLDRARESIIESGTDSRRVGFWGKLDNAKGENIVAEAMDGTEDFSDLQSTDDVLQALKAHMFTKDQLRYSQRFEDRDDEAIENLIDVEGYKETYYDSVFDFLDNLYAGNSEVELWIAFSKDIKDTIKQSGLKSESDVEEILNWIAGLLVENKKKYLVGDKNPLTSLITVLFKRVFGKSI